MYETHLHVILASELMIKKSIINLNEFNRQRLRKWY